MVELENLIRLTLIRETDDARIPLNPYKGKDENDYNSYDALRTANNEWTKAKYRQQRPDF